MVPHRRIHGIDIINLLGAFITVYLGVLLVQTVYGNYMLNRQIETLNGQIGVLKAQQDTLKYNAQYYGTTSFQDKEARAKLGLQLPAEKVIILPSPHMSSPTTLPVEAATIALPKSNFARWVAFLTGKG